MPSMMNGLLLRVPLVRCCSVRQYAYHDMAVSPKLVRGKPAYLVFRDNVLYSNPGRKGSCTVRPDAKSRIQPHLTTGESKIATISWHCASGCDFSDAVWVESRRTLPAPCSSKCSPEH